jgi:hypothetical protein
MGEKYVAQKERNKINPKIVDTTRAAHTLRSDQNNRMRVTIGNSHIVQEEQPSAFFFKLGFGLIEPCDFFVLYLPTGKC